ncbi:MAG: hypothetical protein JWL62_3832 [Hyphomicrobiales bacterium]|nr:hypothetical protein [Hyphomicrobiales bacterium]
MRRILTPTCMWHAGRDRLAILAAVQAGLNGGHGSWHRDILVRVGGSLFQFKFAGLIRGVPGRVILWPEFEFHDVTDPQSDDRHDASPLRAVSDDDFSHFLTLSPAA